MPNPTGPKKPQAQSLDSLWDSPDTGSSGAGAAANTGTSLDDLWNAPDAPAAPPAPSGGRGDIHLEDSTNVAPAVKPAPRRGILDRIGDSFMGAMDQVGKGNVANVQPAPVTVDTTPVPLDAKTAARRAASADYEANLARSRPAPTVNITVPALPGAPAPHRPDVGRHGLASAIGDVLASTRGGVDTGYTPPSETSMDERGYLDSLNSLNTAWSQATDPARKAELQRTIAQLNRQFALGRAEHPEGLEGLASGVIRGASVGFAGDNANMRAAKKALAADMSTGRAVSPSDLEEVGVQARPTMIEKPSGAETAGEFVGTVLPFEAAERGGLAALRGAGGLLEGTRAAKIGDLLGAAGNLHAPMKFDTDIGEFVGTNARRAAAGQIGGAAVAAGHATAAGHPEMIPEAIAEGVGPFAALGAGLGAAGDLVGGAYSVGKGAAKTALGLDVPFDFPQYNRGFGDRIRYASDLVEGTRPGDVALTKEVPALQDKTPIGDKTVEGQRSLLAKMLGEHLNNVEEARGPELQRTFDENPPQPPAGPEWWEANAPAPEPEAQPSPIIQPEQYGGGRNAKAEAADRLRTAQETAMEKAGVDPTSLADQHDLSKRQAVQEAMQKAMEDEAERAAMQKRLDDAAAARPENKQGPLPLSTVLARATREHPEQGADVSQREPVELGEGKNLVERLANSPNMNRHAAAILPLAAAGTTDDDRKRAALIGAAMALAGTTEDVRIPKAAMGAMMKVIRESGAEAKASEWAERLNAVTGGKIDVTPILDKLRAESGNEASVDADAVLSLNDVRRAIGEAANKKATATDVQLAPARKIIPWNERANGGAMFFSRLHNAIADEPDRQMTAAQWYAKLQDNPNFSKTELEWTIGPSLRAIHDGVFSLGEHARVVRPGDEEGVMRLSIPMPDEKLSKQDLLDMLADKQITIAHEQLGAQTHDPNKPAASSEIEAETEDERATRVAEARDARARELHEEDVEAARERMDDVEHTMRRYYDDAQYRIEQEIPGISAREIHSILDAAAEDVEGDYVPTGAVDGALDSLRDHYSSEVKEEDLPTGWKLVDARDEWEKSRDQYETEEAYDEAEPQYAYEVRDSTGKVRGSADEEYDALSEANDDYGFTSEPDWDNIASEISAYLDKRAEWMEAESEHYYLDEGDQGDNYQRHLDELEADDWEPDDMEESSGPPGRATKYEGYQRFSPRGREYREHVVTLEHHGAPDTGSFGTMQGSHWPFMDALGHYRAEFYNAAPYRSLDETALEPYKQQVQSASDALAAFESELVARGVDGNTGAGATPEDFEKAQLLRDQHELAVRKLGEMATTKGETGAPQRTFVLLEAQSDLVQKANERGYKKIVAPPTAEQKQAIQAQIDDLRAKESVFEIRLQEHETGMDSLRHELEMAKDVRHALGRDHDDVVNKRVYALLDERKAALNAADKYAYANAHTDAYREVTEGFLANPPESLKKFDEAAARADELEARYDDALRQRSLLRDEVFQAGHQAGRLEDSLANPGIENPEGLMNTPFPENADVVPLLVKSALWDAVNSGAERFAWSSGEARNQLASLRRSAAEHIYDKLVPAAVNKILDFFGEKVPTEDVGIGGYKLKSVEITPALKEKILKVGLPMLGAIAMVNATSEDAQAQGGKGKGIESAKGLWAVAGAIALLASSKGAREAFTKFATEDAKRIIGRDEESGLLNGAQLSKAKGVVDADPFQSWIVMRPAREARIIPPFAMGTRIMGALRDAGLPAQAFRTKDGYAIAVDSRRASGVLARVETALDRRKVTLRSAIADTYDAADAVSKDAAKSSRPGSLGITLYANPLGPAMKELAKYPSAAALGLLGYAATQSNDERIKDTGLPLIGFAALSAIGSARLGMMGDAVTSPLIERLRASKSGRAAVRFFNPEALLDPEVRQAIVRFEEGVKAGIARGGEIAKRSKALGPEGDRAVSDIVEGEQWEDMSGMSPKDVQNVLTVAAQYADDFVKLGNEKVAAGVLPASSLLPDYAGPRVYAEHEGNAVMQNDETAFNGQSSAKARIAAQKSRTLDLPVREAEAKLAEAQASGDPNAIDDAQNELDQAKLVQLHQRLTLGEIRESSYRGALGMAKGYRDIAAAKLLGLVRQHPGAIHPDYEHALGEFEAAKQLVKSATTPADRQTATDMLNQAKVDMATISQRFNVRGGDYVTLPTSEGLGPLSGMVVKREIAASINGIPDLKTWGTMLRFWKESKTVFNPGTHLGNVLSNVAFAHMEGLSAVEQPRYLIRAALDMKRYGPGTKALAENGTLDFNSVTADNAGITARDMRSEEGLRELAGTTRPETADVLARKGITPEEPSAVRSIAPYLAGAAIGGAYGYLESPDNAKGVGTVSGIAAGLLAGSRPAREFSKRLYSNEDNIYRVAIYLKKIDDGMTPIEAADYSKNALGNFRSRSPALHVLRGTVAPFVLYPAKAVPRLAAQMVDHPWRYVALMSTWALMDQYSRSVMGPVNNKDLAIRDRMRLGYFFPGFVQLPFGGEGGEKAAVDVSRYTPIGSVTTAAPPGSVAATFDENASSLIAGSGPITDATMKFIGNKDPMTGDPVFKQDYTAADNLKAGVEAAADIVLPPAAAFHRQRIVEDVANEDKAALKNDVLGPTGLRPRYVRPGAQALNASFTLQNSLNDMQQTLTRALRKSKSPSRNVELVDQYKRRVINALDNYRERMGAEPPKELVQQADDFINGLDSGHHE